MTEPTPDTAPAPDTAPDPDEYGDLARYLDPDWHPKINGKVYDVKCPGGRLGLKVRMVFTRKRNLTDAQELDLIAEILGDHPVEPTDAELEELGDPDLFFPYAGGVFAQMWEDEVPWPMMVHTGRTALILFGNGSKALAMAYWRRLGQGDADPKLPAKPQPRGKRTKTE